jgi:hypothetical protein
MHRLGVALQLMASGFQVILRGADRVPESVPLGVSELIFLWWFFWLCSQEIATVRECSLGPSSLQDVPDASKTKQLTEAIP